MFFSHFKCFFNCLYLHSNPNSSFKTLYHHLNINVLIYLLFITISLILIYIYYIMIYTKYHSYHSHETIKTEFVTSVL